MQKKRLSKSQKCTTHHICDCKQYKMEQMERALRVIHTWGAFDKEGKRLNLLWEPALRSEDVIEICNNALDG